MITSYSQLLARRYADALDDDGRQMVAFTVDGATRMQRLINELLKKGARRERLQAKVFGGAQVMHNFTSMNVGERNTDFVTQYLQMERIPIIARDVLDIYPRKVCFLPASGKAMVKRLAPTNPDALLAQERAAAQKAAPAAGAGGSVDLF